MSTDLIIVPVILCGGSGTRLWPASREKNPKQFLNLMGEDYSLLQETARRALRISGASSDCLVTVTLGGLRDGVARQIAGIYPDSVRHILSEPSARNTAAAVALAAHYVRETFGEKAVMWVLPADHHIGDENALGMALRDALEAVAQGHLLTFGIRPTRPETGYGYIRLGEKLMGEDVHRADAFVEKPDIQMAREYLDSGIYLWNSGMFLFEAGYVLDQFRRHAPAIIDGVIEAVREGGSLNAPASARYAAIASEPFDVAIMEKSLHVAVVPCNPAWSDIGSWESLWEIRAKDQDGNVKEGRAACVETRNCLVQAQGRLVACVGVENIVVVETADAVLIADRSNGDAMKKLVATLKKTGARETREMTVGPQQALSVVTGGAGYEVREIAIGPSESVVCEGVGRGCRFLTVLQGQALVTTADGQKQLNIGDNLFIQAGTVYRIKNSGRGELKMVDVQKPAEEAPRAENIQSIRNVA